MLNFYWRFVIAYIAKQLRFSQDLHIFPSPSWLISILKLTYLFLLFIKNSLEIIFDDFAIDRIGPWTLILFWSYSKFLTRIAIQIIDSTIRRFWLTTFWGVCFYFFRIWQDANCLSFIKCLSSFFSTLLENWELSIAFFETFVSVSYFHFYFQLWQLCLCLMCLNRLWISQIIIMTFQLSLSFKSTRRN